MQIAALAAGQTPAAPAPSSAAMASLASATPAASTAPRDPPGRLVTVSHPAPPERPRAGIAAAVVPQQQPAPALTSAAQAAAPTPAPANPDRRALDNLFAAAAIGSVPRDLTKITMSRTRAASEAADGRVGAQVSGPGAPAASLGFTQRDPNDTQAGRFSGPAVRPLPTTYISR
jgi:hypothetical protein